MASRAPLGRRLPEAGGLTPDRAARASADLRSALAALAGAGLAPARVEPEDIVIESERAYLDPADLDGAGDASSAEADLERITSGLASGPRRGRRRAMLIGAVAALLLVGAAVLGLLLSHNGSDGPAAAAGPVAKVAARISLGSRPFGIALAGGRVWVSSEAGILPVDPAAKRVVGAPVPLPHGFEPFGVRAEGDVVWASIVRPSRKVAPQWRLLRIDGATGRVTGQIRFPGDILDFRPSDDDVWVIRGGGRGVSDLARFGARSLRPNRPPLPLSGQPTSLSVTPANVWVSDIDGHTLRVPIDPGSASVRFRMGGPGLGGAAGESGLWVPDMPSRTVTAYDAASGRPLGDSAVVPYQPGAISVTPRAIWAATVDGGLFELDGPVELARLDPASRRPVGTPIRVGIGLCGMDADEGSVWVATCTDNMLWHLTAADFPLGPAGPGRPSSSTSPRPLVSGPLGAGPRTSTKFRIPFEIHPQDERWLAIDETPEGVDFVRFDDPGTLISPAVVDRLFRVNGRLAPLRSASQLLERLRARTHVSRPHPSLPFTFGTGPPRGSGCRCVTSRRSVSARNAGCVQLFPIKEGSVYLIREPENVDDVYALDAAGRVLFLDISGPPSRDLSAAARAIEDIGFELTDSGPRPPPRRRHRDPHSRHPARRLRRGGAPR